MTAAIDQFNINISYVKNLGSIYKVLKATMTSAIDLSDILRAELVMAVSALDNYIHEIVRLGMLEIYNGIRNETPAFSRFPVSLGNVGTAASASHYASLLGTTTIDVEWLDNEIRSKHGWQSFQNPEKIADAIRLISEIKLWEEVGKDIGMSSQDLKQKLNLIIDRRNEIAHEADINPTYSGCCRWPIDEYIVDDAVEFIEKIANSIYKVIYII